MEAFQSIVDKAGYAPKLLHTDEGKEFAGSFKKYLDTVDVNSENEDIVFANLYKGYAEAKKNQKPPKFATGNIVKISRQKLIFEKEASNTWSKESFKILKILDTYPWTYKLVDKNGNEIPGGFYQEQLQKVHEDSIYDD
ncbi:hypothetical protein Ocin01_12974 [Orchesella cincta]|uniref:Integrase catalytic domain-containing protein n=1 Tax=Orchesella cincta TaxID=48709 RepID=A0A1D2ML75_ORCCI|nr:hypothetical protein Ocin01_12974 [Orchesella cincta]